MDHVESCGNKTNICAGCNTYVRNKDREDHLTNGGCQKARDNQKMKDFIAAEKAKEQIEKFRLEEE